MCMCKENSLEEEEKEYTVILQQCYNNHVNILILELVPIKYTVFHTFCMSFIIESEKGGKVQYI